MLKRLLSIFVAIILSVNLFDGFVSLKVTAESEGVSSISEKETAENEYNEDEVDIELPKAQTEYMESILARFTITGERDFKGDPSVLDTDKIHIVSYPGSDNFDQWNCIICLNEGGRYRIIAYKPYGVAETSGMTIGEFFERFNDVIVIVFANYNYGQDLMMYLSDKNYVKISNGVLCVYSLTEIETDTPADSETDESRFDGIIHVDAMNVADTEKNKVIVFDKSCDSLIDFRNVTNDTTILCQATDEENTFNIIRRLEPGERIGYSSGSLVSSWIIINVAGSERLAADAEGWNMAQLGATIVLHGVDLENDTITEDAYIGVIGLRNYENILYTIGNNEVSIKGYIGSEKNLVIPSVIDDMPVTAVYDKAFLDCTILESLVIPESVTSIGSNICGGCVNLKKITMPFDKNRTFGSFFGDDPTTSGNKNVPASLKNVIITGAGSIKNSCFSNCKNIESIEIKKLGSMNSSAFYGCDSLTTLTLPFVGLRPGLTYSIDNTLDNLGDFKALKTIEITEMTYLCDETFASCDFLENIILHEGLETIGVNAFKNCTGLKEIKVPKTVTEIKQGAFDGCSNVKVLTIPDSEMIKTMSFKDCVNLSRINISDSDEYFVCKNGAAYSSDMSTLVRYFTLTAENEFRISKSVTSIDAYAFFNCTNLTNVYIPESVTFIDEFSFEGCANLSKVYYADTELAWCDIDVQKNNDILLNANFYFDCKIYFTDESGLSINREKAFITGLDLSTNLSGFLSEFEFFDEMRISGQSGELLGEDDIVGTGCLVQRVVEGFVVEEAYVVLVGDTDGDGDVTVSDTQIAYNHLMGTETIDGVYAEAAKISGNSSISILDIMALLNMM